MFKVGDLVVRKKERQIDYTWKWYTEDFSTPVSHPFRVNYVSPKGKRINLEHAQDYGTWLSKDFELVVQLPLEYYLFIGENDA